MNKDGWTLWGKEGIPIVPVMLWDGKTALEFSNELFDEGVLCKGLAYPIVPKGEARIRVQLSSIHNKENLDFAVEAFKKLGKNRGLI